VFCISLESNDPFFNLAVEEILLKNSKEEFLMLGINSPSVIIGKHQTAHREINTRFVTENKIPVIRRISGGGTVYHDLGNLNFTFIKQSETGRQVDFHQYTAPVIDFLSECGVMVKFEGKSDLTVNGLKISGNAEHVHRTRILHHGTLLFSTSLEKLRNSLRKDISAYTSRAVGSNPSSVTNLNNILPGFKSIYEFRSEMMNYFLRKMQESELYNLSGKEIADAESLANTKYKSWEWNWGYGPEYQFVNRFEFCGHKVYCRLYVKDGTIRDCILEGYSTLADIAVNLIGRRHMVDDLLEVFKGADIPVNEGEIFNFF
jgi:lipoate-protein ligase A